MYLCFMTAIQKILSEGKDIEIVNEFISTTSDKTKNEIKVKHDLYFSKVAEWTNDNDVCDNIN